MHYWLCHCPYHQILSICLNYASHGQTDSHISWWYLEQTHSSIGMQQQQILVWAMSMLHESCKRFQSPSKFWNKIHVAVTRTSKRSTNRNPEKNRERILWVKQSVNVNSLAFILHSQWWKHLGDWVKLVNCRPLIPASSLSQHMQRNSRYKGQA